MKSALKDERAGMPARTPYDQTAFRVSENYLLPDQPVGGVSREEFESTLAQGGVEARWVGVFDHGGPRYASRHMPLSKRVPGDLTDALKRWVATVHAAGMNAITWCSVPYCESAWEEYHDWRSLDLDGNPKRSTCCINSPFGDALIGMALEFIEIFDLDGIWFDGAAFDGLPLKSVPGCSCAACRRKFREDTGHAIPSKVDFDDRIFRAWVRWRFDMFAAYLRNLVDTVHARYPERIITINHYHRYSPNAWHTACPLERFPCDIVTGSEACAMFLSSISSKIAVAYGRKAEVWTPVARWKNGVDWQFHEPAALLHHAAACITYGAYPSFGYETDVPAGSMRATSQSFLKPASDFFRARKPYVELESANPVALHVSQQTETFFFGRHPERAGYGWYWESLVGWDQMLNESGLGVDVVFDGDLTAASLKRYKAVILPLSLALSEIQAQALDDYVREGGLLLLGPWCGRFDEEGMPRSGPGVLDSLRAVTEGPVPLPKDFIRKTVYQENLEVKVADLHGFAVHTMLAQQTPRTDAEVLMKSQEGAMVTRRAHGRGSLIDLAADWGASFFVGPSSPLRRTLIALVEQWADLAVLVKAPSTVRVAVRRGRDGEYLIHLHNCPTDIHQQGYQSGEDFLLMIPRDVIPVCGVTIEIRGAEVTGASRLAERAGELPVEKRDGKVFIALDRIDLHEVVRIQTDNRNHTRCPYGANL